MRGYHDFAVLNQASLVTIDSRYVFDYCQDAWFNLWLRPLFNTALAGTLLTLFLVIFGGVIFGWFDAYGPTFINLVKALLSPFLPFLKASGIESQRFWVFATPVALGVNVLLGAWGIYTALDYAKRPTKVGVREDAIYFVQPMIPPSYSMCRSIRFSTMIAITLERPRAKRSSADYSIVFHTMGGQQHKLRIGDIVEPVERRTFLSMVKRYSPVPPDPQIFEVFEPQTERETYTELWLSELSAAPKRDKLTPLSPGTKLANKRFEIIRKLGMGGQATVYLAFDAYSGDEIALKEYILPVFPNAAVRKNAASKFDSETRILSQIAHPRIVKLYDVFVEDHRAYLVMERAGGRTLKQTVSEDGAMDQDAVVDIALQMCDILSYLHSQNPPVIHRDFTPDNLMLEEDGCVKLIDFTVAQEQELHVTGTVVGKHNYMSPEQFRGKPSVQSDIYSMSASLYFLLTGAEPEAISQLHPADVSATVRDALNSIVAKGTALDTNARYKSIAEMRVDLEAIIAGHVLNMSKAEHHKA